MNDLGVPSPELADPASGETGVGDQVINPLSTQLIPLTQGMQLPTDQGAEATARQAGSPEIGVHLIPGVTHWGMHVTHMQLIGRGQNTLRNQMAAADHQIDITQIDLFNGQRQ